MFEARRKHLFGAEVTSQFPNSRIEPGIHPVAEGDYKRINDEIQSGNLDIHAWNPEVAKRVRAYNPKILSIDGLTTITYFNPVNDALNIWFKLPDRPSRINQSGEVFVVSGDPVWRGLVERGLVLPGTQEYGDLEKKFHTIDENEQMDMGLRRIASHAVVFGGAVAATVAGSYKVITSFQTNTKDWKNKVSTILAGVGVSTVVATGVNLFSPHLAARAHTEKGRQFWQEVMGIGNASMKNHSWLNGRTAVLITKHEDAYDLLGLSHDTPGSIILGFSHLHGSAKLVNNLEYRNQVILRYTSELMDTFSELMQSTGKMTDEEARNAVFNYVTEGSIHKVLDPGTDRLDNLLNTLPLYVNYQTGFCSSSLYNLLLPLNPLLKR